MIEIPVGLIRQILEHPDNDEARLLVADYLEENGEQERCDFIRTQIELFRIGPPHKQAVGVMKAHKNGINFWIDITQSTDRLFAGDRVDVKGWAPRAGLNDEQASGLLVVKQLDDPYNNEVWLLRRDSKSKPYPKETSDRLQKQETELLRKNGLRWLPIPPITGQVKGESYPWSVGFGLLSKRFIDSEAYFDRGFIHKLKCPSESWLKFADQLCWHPKCWSCNGEGKLSCSKCSGEGCSAQGMAANGPCTAGDKCKDCKGTGKQLRECPATAQPIKRVVLTTMPEIERELIPSSGGHAEFIRWRLPGKEWRRTFNPERNLIQTALRAEWKWIDFELP